MPAIFRVLILLSTFTVSAACADAFPQEPAKKTDTSKLPAPAVSPPPREALRNPSVALPDGSILWPGVANDGDRVLLTAPEYQRLLDQIEQLKKEIAERKATPPSSCSIHVRIEKRGEASVAAIRLTASFRTTTSNAAITLGAKRSFLVSATLDGQGLPVLETAESGYVLSAATVGVHTAILNVECPIASRGGKPDIGFELGLPHAAITTLAFEPPPNVTRVSLTTRTAEAGKPADPRRVSGLDVKSIAPPAPMRDPYPLGPVESLELTWEPPAAMPVADVQQTAELDATFQIADTFVETNAKFRLKGASRTWNFAAPNDATWTFERLGPPGATEPTTMPTVVKPTDPARPVWKISIPVGLSASDWIVAMNVRSMRPKPGEPGFTGPFPLGPLSVLDTARMTGSIKIAAPANTRLSFRHGRELRQEALAAGTDDETTATFRLTSGPTGAAYPVAPLMTVEAAPLAGRVLLRPSYKLNLTEAGWNVRAELKIAPLRVSLGTLVIELPADWRSPEILSADLVDKIEPSKMEDGRQQLKVHFASEHRQPFDLVFTASIPLEASAREVQVLFPRFPGTTERDALATATVGEAWIIHGSGREWDGEKPAIGALPLAAAPGTDGKPTRAATNLSGKFERGLARLELTWSPYRPPLSAEVRAELVVRDSQIVVSQRFLLRSSESLPRTIRFAGAAILPGLSPFERLGPGTWLYATGADAQQNSFTCEYAIPLPEKSADGTWSVPIHLVLPQGTSRTDVVARVWVAGSRSVTTAPSIWRVVPPEPAAERDILPALTLAGSGGDLPVQLKVHESADARATTAWIERGLIQATHGDEGVSYRVRFMLRRWMADSLELTLPAALAEAIPEVYLDDPPQRIPATVQIIDGERILRIPLPEPRTGSSLSVEVRYVLVPAPLEESVRYSAPQPHAAFTGPVRWQISGPTGTTPLLLDHLRSEQHWRTRYGMVVPLAASSDELGKWYLTGSAAGLESSGAETAVVRVAAANSIVFIHLPRLALIIGASLTVLILGLTIARFRGRFTGPLVAILAGAAAVATGFYPQLATEIAAAAEPGFAALVLVLVTQAVARWRHRQQITYLPGFARSQPQGGGPLSTSGGSRPSDRMPPSPPAGPGSTGDMAPQPVSTGS